MRITSPQNSKVKLVNRLRSKRGRETEKRFLIDHQRDLRRALGQGYCIDFLLYCPDLVSPDDLPDSEVHELSADLLKRVSYRENPSGIVAVLHSGENRGSAELEAAEVNTAIVMVDLRVPGNIGALLRSADATALDAIILVDTSLDLYNPNIIRSSTGACFLDNIFLLSSEQAISYFKRGGFQIVSADPQGKKSIFEVDLCRKTAIVLGTEDSGLSPVWSENADSLVRIPMASRVTDSLNVSVTGAVFMYELYRQRQVG